MNRVLYVAAALVLVAGVLVAILLPSSHAQIETGAYSGSGHLTPADHRILLRLLIGAAGGLAAVALVAFVRVRRTRSLPKP